MTKPAAIDDAHLRNLLAKLFTAHGVDAVEAKGKGSEADPQMYAIFLL
jgi:hypothetical protein